jgi:hypothetical protein
MIFKLSLFYTVMELACGTTVFTLWNPGVSRNTIRGKNDVMQHVFFYFFKILDCEAVGTVATPGLLCQPRVIVKMIVE